MIYVVGSGPAGVSAAHALLNNHHDVTLLDVGEQLEPGKSAIVNHLHQKSPAEWPAGMLEKIKGNMPASRHGVALKTVYGSTFPYRSLDEVLEVPSAIEFKSSFACGGLSHTWGSVILPFHANDIPDWPIPLPDLESHYRSVLELMPVSADHDDLDSLLPVYKNQTSPLRFSQQASRWLSHLNQGREELTSHGIAFGRSRLAVRASSGQNEPGCVYCGLCLSGCPYELIYTSAQTLERLKSHPKFQYVPKVRVKRFQEDERGVTVEGESFPWGEKLKWTGQRVFLACGSLTTTEIILSSLGLYNQDIRFKTNQYFILPIFLKYGAAHVTEEKLHTLCQLLVVLRDATVSPYLVNLQFYTYNELFLNLFRRTAGFLAGPLGSLGEWGLGHLGIFQGYLHSVHSPEIGLRMQKGAADDRVQLTPIFKEETKVVLNRLLTKLYSCRRILGGRVLKSLLSVGKIGDGSHVGGSFPMKQNPGPLESDIWGRPAGLRYVHAVDSTVLPSIPATTITLSVMANAHRICSRQVWD